MEMSYDFYINHNMDAVEWKLNAPINKNKKLLIKLDRNWRHPLKRKIQISCLIIVNLSFSMDINADNRAVLCFLNSIF